jgi:hypothetical protein
MPIRSPWPPPPSPFHPPARDAARPEEFLSGAPHTCRYFWLILAPPVSPSPPSLFYLIHLAQVPLPDLFPSSSLQEIKKNINGRSPLPPYAAPVILFSFLGKQSSPPSSPSGFPRRGGHRRVLSAIQGSPETRRSSAPVHPRRNFSPATVTLTLAEPVSLLLLSRPSDQDPKAQI